jgi:methylase of polypeptide subunit release factors
VRPFGSQAVVRQHPQGGPDGTRVIGTSPEHVDFDGLTIAFDARVLRPRPWTAEQSRWAACLLSELPPGPVLELCSGAGQIGLAAVRRTDRSLVCVDADPAAVDFGRDNAREAGLAGVVEFRLGRIDDVLGPEETFSLIIADPPWVTSAEVSRYPEDPRSAIDGGDDGLAVARLCLLGIDEHLDDGGAALLQLGSVDQVAELLSLGSGSLRCVEVRQYDGGVVARLDRADATVAMVESR